MLRGVQTPENVMMGFYQSVVVLEVIPVLEVVSVCACMYMLVYMCMSYVYVSVHVYLCVCI